MTLMDAAAKAEELAQSGAERELATLRQQWDEENRLRAEGSGELLSQGGRGREKQHLVLRQRTR